MPKSKQPNEPSKPLKIEPVPLPTHVYVNTGTWGIAKQVHADAEKAKGSWILLYVKIGKPTFVETADGDLMVFHPLDKNCQVGMIQVFELLNRVEHL